MWIFGHVAKNLTWNSLTPLVTDMVQTKKNNSSGEADIPLRSGEHIALRCYAQTDARWRARARRVKTSETQCDRPTRLNPCSDQFSVFQFLSLWRVLEF